MFRKHKVVSRVPLFFRKPVWSPARFSPIFFSIRPKVIFVKVLDVCVRILKVQYSSHFVDLLFFGNITIILFLKSSRIFPVVYMLLIRRYKVWLVSSSSACSNSAGVLSTSYAFFYFNSFNAFSNSDFVIVRPSSSGVISSSLSNSSSSSKSLYNSSTYCCHLSVISSSSIRAFLILIQ